VVQQAPTHLHRLSIVNAITAGDRSDNGSTKQDHKRQQLESKITFIESQVDSLSGFVPDSYPCLIQQLDQHQHQLLKIILQDGFDTIDCMGDTTSKD
jgi:hypothetical protein